MPIKILYLKIIKYISHGILYDYVECAKITSTLCCTNVKAASLLLHKFEVRQKNFVV
mgnify:CR=1 FL=1